jgi:hypothetical protein
MTLFDFFQFLGQNPIYITLYFLAVPLFALLINWIAAGHGHESPWNYLYSATIFAACVPGVLSVALSVYFFLFERGSILNTNILTQVLPVLSMILTISIVKRNVALQYVPGSERISSMMFLIGATIVLMFVLDRTRIFAFVMIPVQYFLLILVGALIAMRFALKRIMA